MLSRSYIDNEYFEHMGDIIYPKEVQLNKTNITDTEADLELSIPNDLISINI